jgi:hypothetical protein
MGRKLGGVHRYQAAETWIVSFLGQGSDHIKITRALDQRSSRFLFGPNPFVNET